MPDEPHPDDVPELPKDEFDDPDAVEAPSPTSDPSVS